MTLQEINKFLIGATPSDSGCTIYGGNNTIGFPGICVNDGPAGVRGVELVNAYPAGLSVAASWNTELANERGRYMGREFRAKGGRLKVRTQHRTE